MTVQELQYQLLSARKFARKTLSEKCLKHVIYAYEKKSDPGVIHIRDWLIKFKTDEDFNHYLEANKDELAMVYAVHARK